MNIMNRETLFTPEEWQALPRNDQGDLIVSDLGMYFVFMPKGSIDSLSCDDYARLMDHQEEMQCLWNEALIEFGGVI